MRLIDHKLPNADCGYSGLECLPDGTFVSATYAVVEEDEVQSIVCVRYKLEEFDELASHGSSQDISHTRFWSPAHQVVCNKNELCTDRICINLEHNHYLETYE